MKISIGSLAGVVLAVLMLVPPAWGQVVGVAQAPSRITTRTERDQTISIPPFCSRPAYPEELLDRPLPMHPDVYISWCSETTTFAQRWEDHYTSAVEIDGTLQEPLSLTCMNVLGHEPATYFLQCLGYFSTPVQQRLWTPGRHTVVGVWTSKADGMVYRSGPRTIITGCEDVDRASAPFTPLTAVAPFGTIRSGNTGMTNASFFASVDLLRARNWQVEWQRARHSTQDTWYWYCNARCVQPVLP